MLEAVVDRVLPGFGRLASPQVFGNF